MAGDERIVIVGAGVGGLRAAERLRELNFDGELVIIGDESRRPYHRPAISKHMVAGTTRPAELTLKTTIELDARWRFGTRATRLETDRRLIHLPGGEEMRYDGLIIATGVLPRHLIGAPRHDPRVRVLRTVDDALAVRAALAASDRPAVVIGGGLIGSEFAATMRQIGRDVTLVGHSLAALHRFGPRVSKAVTDQHLRHRAGIAMSTLVRHWITTKHAVGLHLTNDQLLVASVVVLAIGSVPAVDWLRGSGLNIDDGILCDASLYAEGADDVVVVGDAARWPNLRFDEVPRRVEHWLNAVESGRAAAENLMAGRSRSEPYMPIPRAWSTQYGVRMQMAGIPSLGDDTVALDDGITGYVRGGQLVGVCSWDRPKAMLRWTAELERRLPIPLNLPVPQAEAVMPPLPMNPAIPSISALAAELSG
ncbi:MAG: hypothetical protein QOI21_5953 [Actinomycetota bacterium]|jgi:NADPH-dependent 2,4-dienoyl-CoA reductase/sulfur reductase-like enzyme|nr:hypothetical protein [Actinomycetota bacterium]